MSLEGCRCLRWKQGSAGGDLHLGDSLEAEGVGRGPHLKAEFYDAPDPDPYRRTEAEGSDL